jgi:hypothetical protein
MILYCDVRLEKEPWQSLRQGEAGEEEEGKPFGWRHTFLSSSHGHAQIQEILFVNTNHARADALAFTAALALRL